MKRRVLSVLAAAVLAVSMAACGSGSSNSGSAAETEAETEAVDTSVEDAEAAGEDEAAAEETAAAEAADSGQVYHVGICQLVQHDALDAATQGFQDALVEKLGEGSVEFDLQNAAGDSATCATIVNGFVSDEVDLIMANATASLQAAAAATADIPILATSITDYATALDMDSWDGVTGRNISGTSDLAPLDQQAAMIQELFPDASTVGVLYCSAEPNSQYQSDVITEALTGMGYTVTPYTFADSNDIASVATNASADCDVIYIPTDNTAASNTSVIDNVCLDAQVPIVAGEESICKGCGIATLSISYYDLGYQTGLQAYEVLVNGADVASMQVETAPNVTKEYVASRCEALGITIPDGYEAMSEE